METMLMDAAVAAVENVYAALLRAGLLSVDSDDPSDTALPSHAVLALRPGAMAAVLYPKDVLGTNLFPMPSAQHGKDSEAWISSARHFAQYVADEQVRSVSISTRVSRGIRPGTEDKGHRCGADHINFITAARNVA